MCSGSLAVLSFYNIMDYFKLCRDFWDFAYENPEKIKPNHCALYLFIVEHCNRLGWKKKFGLPTTMTKDAIGIKSYSVYKKTFDDLCEFGFFDVLEYSKNQYSSNIIALKENNKALCKALDKAFVKHDTKQSESTVQSTDSIIKQYTINKEQYTINQVFEWFWDLYDKKVDNKKCKNKFLKLKEEDVNSIIENLEKYIASTPNKKFRKNPLTWLNGSCWLDNIEQPKKTNKVTMNFTNPIL